MRLLFISLFVASLMANLVLLNQYQRVARALQYNITTCLRPYDDSPHIGALW